MTEEFNKLPGWLQMLISPIIFVIMMIPVAIAGFIILAIIGSISPQNTKPHYCSAWEEEACESLYSPSDEPIRDPWEELY